MENTKQMISIWFWVGIVMVVYGILVSSTGIYYIFSPPENYGAKWTNPNLWWGTVMLLTGLLFMYLGRTKKGSN